ncbi:hypothetical protein F5880DRAFT_694268 [Lentinula raphanica]|nr:hypothetical protein F5880DRAFT_694268 [Lentinula raphanica]
MYWSKYTNLLLLGPSLLMASTWALPHEPIQPRSPTPRPKLYVPNLSANLSPEQIGCLKAGIQSLDEEKRQSWKIPKDFDLLDPPNHESHHHPGSPFHSQILVLESRSMYASRGFLNFYWSVDPSRIQLLLENWENTKVAIGTEDSDKMFRFNIEGEYEVVPKLKGEKAEGHKQSSATTV